MSSERLLGMSFAVRGRGAGEFAASERVPSVESSTPATAAAQQSATLFAHYRRQLLKENDA